MNLNPANVFRSLINPAALAQLAMGPAGWASLALKAVMSEVVQQVIQQLGEKMGLPQSAIDTVKSAAGQALGATPGAGGSIRQIVEAFGKQAGASPSEIGHAERVIDQAATQMQENIKRAMGELTGGEGKKKVKGGQSWLQALADAMTRVVDKSLTKLDAKSTELANIQEAGGKIKSTDRKEIAANQAMSTKAQQDFNVSVQEFNIISNAVTNAIKTIGEALTAMSRKN